MAYGRDALARAIRTRLEENPSCSLSQMASECGVGRHLIESACRDVLRKSYRSCQREAKLAQVIELLSDPQTSIKAVALTIGFQRSHSLSRFVRRNFSCSPSGLRARLRASELDDH